MVTNNMIKISIAALSFLVFAACFSGCAELNLLSAPKEVLSHPLGSDPIKLGMSMDEVIGIWGEPDQVNQLSPTDEWNTPRVEWVYIGRYSKIPLDKSYLFKTKTFVFDGKHLVSIRDEDNK